MATGSFARGALVELTDDDLVRMLELDESLFVEHKSDIGEKSSYQIAKAASSFANTLGEWLLIGVREGKPLGSESSVWTSSESPPLVDVIRDCLRGEVDPLPAFEAKTMRPPGVNRPVGVVRVYESSDTPHIVVSSGSVFVREGPGDTDAAATKKAGPTARGTRRYVAAQIQSRAQLIELAQRGEVAAARVRAFMDYRTPPAEELQALVADGRVTEAPELAYLSEQTFLRLTLGAGVDGFRAAWQQVLNTWRTHASKPPGDKDLRHAETHVQESADVLITDDHPLRVMCRRLGDHGFPICSMGLEDYLAARKPTTTETGTNPGTSDTESAL